MNLRFIVINQINISDYFYCDIKGLFAYFFRRTWNLFVGAQEFIAVKFIISNNPINHRLLICFDKIMIIYYKIEGAQIKLKGRKHFEILKGS